MKPLLIIAINTYLHNEKSFFAVLNFQTNSYKDLPQMDQHTGGKSLNPRPHTHQGQ